MRKGLIIAIGTAAISMSLAVSIPFFAAKSYREWGFTAWQNRFAKVEIEWNDGQIGCSVWRIDPKFPLDEKSQGFRHWSYAGAPRTFSRLNPEKSLINGYGFGMIHHRNFTFLFDHVFAVSIPLWFAFLCLAAAAGVTIRYVIKSAGKARW